MTTSRFRATAALIVALGIAACGDSDGGPTFAATADSATIARLAAGAGAYASITLFGAFGAQSSTVDGFLYFSKGPDKATATDRARAIIQHFVRATSFRGSPSFEAVKVPTFAAPFSTCAPTETGVDALGDLIDSDANGIPDNYTVNFGSACVEQDSAGTSRLTWSGSIHLQDDGLGFLSFSLGLDHLSFKLEDLTSPGNFTKLGVHGTEVVQFAAARAEHATDFTLSLDIKSGSTIFSESASEDETSSFEPDGGGALTLGGDLPAGLFNYSSDFKVIGERSLGDIPGNFDLVLSTPTPLHYDPACRGDITAGEFRGLLNGDPNIGFTVTWSSCGNSTTVIFGDTPATAVAAR